MNSLDSGNRQTSIFGKMSRKGVSNGDANDTPELREKRIQLYMARAEAGLDLFSGEPVSHDEIDVEDENDE